MKKWKAAGLITVAGACVIAIVWGLHGRTKNNAKLLQLDEQVSDDSVMVITEELLKEMKDIPEGMFDESQERLNEFFTFL